MKIKDILDKLSKIDTLCFSGLEGYKVGRYLAVSYDEILHNYQSEKKYFRLLSKTIIRCFFRDYTYDFTNEMHGKVLLFYSHEHARRKDYVNFMKDVSCLIGNSYLFTGTDTSFKPKIGGCEFSNLYKLIGWYKQLSKIETNTYNKLYLLSKISLAYRWKSELERNWHVLKDIRGVVTIFDAREYENVLTQFLSKKEIRSATLQHGFFSVLNDNRGYLAIPFTGFVSDEFWAWGRYSCETARLSGMPKEKCVAVGYPKSFSRLVKKNNHYYVMGIILDGGEALLPINKEILTMALEVAMRLNLKIVLKPHPNDKYDYVSLLGDFQDYEMSNDTIFEFGENVDFSLCYASSAYIDLIAMGSIVYRYRKNNRENGYSRLDNVDTFTDTRELQNLIVSRDGSINDTNRKELLGNLSDVERNYNIAAANLFGL